MICSVSSAAACASYNPYEDYEVLLEALSQLIENFRQRPDETTRLIQKLASAPALLFSGINGLRGKGDGAYIIHDEQGTVVYAGSAVDGGRKGHSSKASKNALFNRGKTHGRSLEQAGLLGYRMKAVATSANQASACELLLINHFKPLWNCDPDFDGFGNHDPGKGRATQRRSQWDIRYPGRPWAEKLLA